VYKEKRFSTLLIFLLFHSTFSFKENVMFDYPLASLIFWFGIGAFIVGLTLTMIFFPASKREGVEFEKARAKFIGLAPIGPDVPDSPGRIVGHRYGDAVEVVREKSGQPTVVKYRSRQGNILTAEVVGVRHGRMAATLTLRKSGHRHAATFRRVATVHRN
jgi:hypothetical protein